MGLGEELGGTGSRRGGYAEGRARCGAEGALGHGEGKIREAAIQKSLLQ